MASRRALQLWLILVLVPALGAVEWYALHVPASLRRLAQLATSGALPDAPSAGHEIIVFYAYLIAPALIVGVIVSFIATGLGPARIRALLGEQQAWQFGAVATALLCAAQTGFIWAALREDDFGTMIWSVAIAASYQVFILIWLMLATRAAAAAQPMRVGLQLVGAAIGTFSTAYYALVLLLSSIGGTPENLATWALLILLATAYVVLPPAILTCGIAALVTGLRAMASGTARRDANEQD